MLSDISALHPEPSPESLQQGVLTLKIDKTQLICNYSYFNLGGLEHCFGGLDHHLPHGDWIGFNTSYSSWIEFVCC